MGVPEMFDCLIKELRDDKKSKEDRAETYHECYGFILAARILKGVTKEESERMVKRLESASTVLRIQGWAPCDGEKSWQKALFGEEKL